MRLKFRCCYILIFHLVHLTEMCGARHPFLLRSCSWTLSQDQSEAVLAAL